MAGEMCRRHGHLNGRGRCGGGGRSGIGRMEWQCSHVLVFHILALQRRHTQFRKNGDDIHVGAVVEDGDARGGFELERMPPVWRDAEHLSGGKGKFDGFGFVEIGLIGRLGIPCADGRPKLEVVVVFLGVHIFGVLGRNEFHAHDAVGDHKHVSTIDEIAQRCFCVTGTEPDIVPALGEEGWAEKLVVVLKGLHQSGFGEEFVVVLAEKSRLRVVREQFLGEVELKRNMELDILLEVVGQVANFDFESGVVLIPDGRDHCLLKVMEFGVDGAREQSGLAQFEDFFEAFFGDAVSLLGFGGQVVDFQVIAGLKLVLDVEIKKENDAEDDEESGVV